MQSIHATEPSMIGAPDGAGRHATPANLSPPLTANFRHRSSWSKLRMLMQNDLAALILGKLLDFLVGRNATMGGSSDTEVNEPTAIPTGSPSGPTAVTTVTPVG